MSRTYRSDGRHYADEQPAVRNAAPKAVTPFYVVLPRKLDGNDKFCATLEEAEAKAASFAEATQGQEAYVLAVVSTALVEKPKATVTRLAA